MGRISCSVVFFVLYCLLSMCCFTSHSLSGENFREELFLRTIADQHIEATWKFNLEFEPTSDHLCSNIWEEGVEGEKSVELCHFDLFPSEIAEIFYATSVNKFSLSLIGGLWQSHWGEPMTSLHGPSGTSIEAEFPSYKTKSDDQEEAREYLLQQNNSKLKAMLSKLIGLDLDVSSKYGTVHKYPTSLICDDVRMDIDNSSYKCDMNRDGYVQRTRSEYPRLKPALNHLWPLLRLMSCSTGQPNNPSIDNTDEETDYGLGGLSSLIDYEVFFGSEYYALSLNAKKVNCGNFSSFHTKNESNHCRLILETEYTTVIPNVMHETLKVEQNNQTTENNGIDNKIDNREQDVSDDRYGEFSLFSLLNKVHLHEPRPRQINTEKKKFSSNIAMIDDDDYNVNVDETYMLNGVNRNRRLPTMTPMVMYIDKILSSLSGCPLCADLDEGKLALNSLIHVITPLQIVSHSYRNRHTSSSTSSCSDNQDERLTYLSKRKLEFNSQLTPLQTDIVSYNNHKDTECYIKSNMLVTFTSESVGKYYGERLNDEILLTRESASSELISLTDQEVSYKKYLLFKERRKRVKKPLFTIIAEPALIISSSDSDDVDAYSSSSSSSSSSSRSALVVFAPSSETMAEQWYDQSSIIVNKRLKQYEAWKWRAAIHVKTSMTSKCQVLVIQEPIIDQITTPLYHSLNVDLSWYHNRSLSLFLDDIPHTIIQVKSDDSRSNRYQSVSSLLELFVPLSTQCFTEETGRSEVRKYNFKSYSKLSELFKSMNEQEEFQPLIVNIQYDFTVNIIPMEYWPPDAARGFDMPPTRAKTVNPFIEEDVGNMVYSSSPLLLPPMSDFSMPFNVITLTSTLFAGLLGSLLNVLTKDLQKRKKNKKKGFFNKVLQSFRPSPSPKDSKADN